MQPNEISEETLGDDVDSTGSSCGDNPRSNKPLMEKRRRARINKSLNELKTMLLQALKGNQSCGHSKLEKADILEMTVRYMKKLEQHKARSSRIDPGVLNKYKAGFNECRNEVMKFLSTHEGVSVDVRTRLLDHLANCQQTLQDQEQGNFMEDEFIGISNDNFWSSSDGFEDTTAPRSPSASHAKELKSTKTTFESHANEVDNTTKATSHVEGQIRIISTETLSPRHSVLNDSGHSCDEAAIELPNSKDGNALSGVTAFMKSPPRGTCANGLPNSPNNGSQVLIQAPNGHFLVMAPNSIADHSVYKQHFEPNAQENFYQVSRRRAVPRAPNSSAVWTSRPHHQTPELPTIDYRQLQFSHAAVLRRTNSTQDPRSLEHNEPWRPWQNSDHV